MNLKKMIIVLFFTCYVLFYFIAPSLLLQIFKIKTINQCIVEVCSFALFLFRFLRFYCQRHLQFYKHFINKKVTNNFNGVR